jgi:hypothetical protein
MFRHIRSGLSQVSIHCLIFDVRSLMKYILPQQQQNFRMNYKLEQIYFRSLYTETIMDKYDISLTLNTDGAPVFSSSNTSIWPVLATIDNLEFKLQKSNVILLGMWIARKGQKPDFSRLLSPIVEQLNKTLTDPISWTHVTLGTVTSKIIVTCISCDSIAKPPVQGLMQFNAIYGCSYCLHKEARHYFTHMDERSMLRTNESHRLNAARLNDDSGDQLGIASASPLLELKYFDIIKGIIILNFATYMFVAIVANKERGLVLSRRTLTLFILWI